MTDIHAFYVFNFYLNKYDFKTWVFFSEMVLIYKISCQHLNFVFVFKFFIFVSDTIFGLG